MDLQCEHARAHTHMIFRHYCRRHDEQLRSLTKPYARITKAIEPANTNVLHLFHTAPAPQACFQTTRSRSSYCMAALHMLTHVAGCCLQASLLLRRAPAASEIGLLHARAACMYIQSMSGGRVSDCMPRQSLLSQGIPACFQSRHCGLHPALLNVPDQSC